jgi:PadR family transcriptional regulator, regulatory protein PadR
MTMTDTNWHEQLRRGTLELAVLLSVAPAPSYGLEIIRHLEFADLVLTEGTIYPMLARLERDGLLDARWVEGQGPRARKYYQLTPSGRARMKKMAQEFRAIAHGMEEMIATVIGDER